ncbi:MAG: SpoIIE family protein phosphatase [Candidatus Acidiferrales bacterium]
MSRVPPSQPIHPDPSFDPERAQLASEAFYPGSEPAEVAARLVKLVASQSGIAGARFWRVAGERPAVTHEVGQLPEANTLRAGQLLSGVQPAPASGKHLAWVLGNASHRLGILEAFGDAPLPPTTIDRVDELRRYAEAALDEPAPLSNQPEMLMIIDAFQRLNATFDLADVIQNILELAIRYSGAERASVFLYDSEGDEIWSLTRHGSEEKEIRFPAARGVAGWVARHGESANLLDAYADSRFTAEVDRAPGCRTRNLLAWPLTAKNGKTIAVVELLNKHESGGDHGRDGGFTADDEQVLRALARPIVAALENARHSRTLRRNSQRDRDLDLAREVHAETLSKTSLHIPGFELAGAYRSSPALGADYFDFLPLNSRSSMAVLADIEGKGWVAANGMAKFRAVFRALAANVHSMEKLTAALNEAWLSSARTALSVAMFLALLDQLHGVLHFINAGHVAPVVIRADGSAERLEQGGTILGMIPGCTYQRGFSRLSPGDVFVGFSNGTTQAARPGGEEFGIDRLVDFVRRRSGEPASHIADAILEEVGRYARDAAFEDDRAVTILKAL